MNRASQSLAWAGIAIVTLGMALAFAAVVAGGAGDVSTTAPVETVTTGAGDTTPLLVDPGGEASTGTGTVATGTGRSIAPSAEETAAPGAAAAGEEATGTPGRLEPDLDGPPGGTDGGDTGPALTTATGGSLEERLLATVPALDFVVFALRQPGWRVTALDAGGRGDSAYLTLAYENGEDYVNLSQSPSGTRPSLTNGQQIELRGLTAEIYQMQPVLLLRWDERGTGLLFSTDLTRERALALATSLEPLP